MGRRHGCSVVIIYGSSNLQTKRAGLPYILHPETTQGRFTPIAIRMLINNKPIEAQNYCSFNVKIRELIH